MHFFLGALRVKEPLCLVMYQRMPCTANRWKIDEEVLLSWWHAIRLVVRQAGCGYTLSMCIGKVTLILSLLTHSLWELYISIATRFPIKPCAAFSPTWWCFMCNLITIDELTLEIYYLKNMNRPRWQKWTIAIYYYLTWAFGSGELTKLTLINWIHNKVNFKVIVFGTITGSLLQNSTQFHGSLCRQVPYCLIGIHPAITWGNLSQEN